MRNPDLVFHTREWMAATESLSLAASGLLVHLMSKAAQEIARPGYLRNRRNGRPMTIDTIGKWLNIRPVVIGALMAELINTGLIKKDQFGYYSPQLAEAAAAERGMLAQAEKVQQ
jgi:hypothetical protein